MQLSVFSKIHTMQWRHFNKTYKYLLVVRDIAKEQNHVQFAKTNCTSTEYVAPVDVDEIGQI
jgi:hypothetical protein